MNEVLKFTTNPSIDRVSSDDVEVGQYHVLSVSDGTFEARKIFAVDRNGIGALTIRTGDPASSLRRDFGKGKKVDILREPGLPGFFVDWDGKTRCTDAPGTGMTCRLVQRGHTGVDVIDAEGFVIHEATFFPTLEAATAAGVLVELIR